MAVRREISGNRRGRNYRDRLSMQRVIIKQGYLKKLPNSEKFGASLKRPEKRWFIFGVMCNQDPYLEYYENEDCIFSSPPLKMIFLDGCEGVTPNQRISKYSNIFSIVLKNRQLSLIAPSKDAMMEWCRAIEGKLVILGIIEGRGDYVQVPIRSSSMPPRTSITRPRPASIAYSPQYENNQSVRGVIPSAANSNSAASQIVQFAFRQLSAAEEEEMGRNCISMPADATRNLIELSSNDYGTRSSRPGFDDHDYTNTVYLSPNRSNESQSTNNPTNNSGMPAITSEISGDGITSHNDQIPLIDEGEADYEGDIEQQQQQSVGQRPTMLPFLPTYHESLSSPTSDIPSPSYEIESPHLISMNSENGGGESEAHEEPPPYMSHRLLALGANTPLTPSQVQQMRDEMASPDGLTVLISKKDCRHALALVNCFGSVWIIGWHQRSYPYFQSVLHIGDQLISVNDRPARDATVAKSMIKSCADKMDVSLRIVRTPFAKVFCIERDNPADSLGLSFVKGTAEISSVDPEGLAAQHGLTAMAPSVSGVGRCNWWITEVNSQPLNLFNRNYEITRYLQAKGTHISIVVQPAELICVLQHQFRSVNDYKDYIVQ